MNNSNQLKYEDLVEKLKAGTICVPEGKYNPSTVFAVALTNKVCEKEKIEYPDIKRVPEQSVGEFKNNLTIGFKSGELSNVPDGGKLSASKMFSIAGKELYGETSSIMEDNFIRNIDEAVINKTEGKAYDSPYMDMIDSIKPLWDEPFSNKDSFANAVRFAEQGLEERYEKAFMEGPSKLDNLISELEKDIVANREHSLKCSEKKAENIIKNDIQNINTIKGNKEYNIANFSVAGIPYNQIKEYVSKENLDIAGYTFPSKAGITYKPLNEEKLPIPEKWKNLEKKDLEKEDVGITYCHKKGISVTFDNQDNCMKGLEKMVEYQEQSLGLNKSDISIMDSERKDLADMSSDELLDAICSSNENILGQTSGDNSRELDESMDEMVEQIA